MRAFISMKEENTLRERSAEAILLRVRRTERQAFRRAIAATKKLRSRNDRNKSHETANRFLEGDIIMMLTRSEIMKYISNKHGNPWILSKS